jgi:hypothetical protein
MGISKKTRKRNKKKWLSNLEKLKYYVYQNGNKSINRKKHGELAEWVNNQRRAHRNELLIKNDSKPSSGHRILEEQIKILDDINFIWETNKNGRRIFNCDEIEFKIESDNMVPEVVKVFDDACNDAFDDACNDAFDDACNDAFNDALDNSITHINKQISSYSDSDIEFYSNF